MNPQNKQIININVVKQLFQFQLDNNLLPKVKNAAGVKKIDCKKGCGHCCRTNMILVAEEEAKAIVQFLESPAGFKIKPIVIQSAKQISATVCKSVGGPSVPCIFLNEANECMIYDDRPILCRPIYSENSILCKTLDQTGPSALPDGCFDWATPLKKYSFSALKQGCQANTPFYEINSFMHLIYHVFTTNQIDGWLAGKLNIPQGMIKGKLG